MPQKCWRLSFSLSLLLLAPTAAAAQPATIAAAKYAKAAEALEQWIATEVTEKRLPALSIALVDDQHIVWARGFGLADPEANKPATADTLYRVGSVSKLFTDIAVMQLVEQGAIDIDASVTDYLPDFKPTNPFNKPITLRQMMAHRSGLVREPPVGHYFDDTNPGVAKMVESLNRTALVYEPGTRTKYSNAAVATVGYVLQKKTGVPFEKWVQEKVLTPLGMKQSSFTTTPEVKKQLAKAVMWTYHGREFPAPTFELGAAPAGCMYSTANDLARFMTVLFNDGKTPAGRLLKPETLRQTLTPQFAKEGEKTRFGIGFSLGELDGHKRVGHGGAIYGFATDLAFLPEEKLGVVVIASRDVANPLVARIADSALKQMLAAKRGLPLPRLEMAKPLPPDLLLQLAGRYRSEKNAFDLIPSAGRLYIVPQKGGFRTELRRGEKSYISDGILGSGLTIEPAESNPFRLIVHKDAYNRDDSWPGRGPPEEAPDHFRGLIGEYGWDHNTLFIFEKDHKLHALIEWFFIYPLTQETQDIYRFPDDFGLYHGEKLVFRRGANGKATEVEAASVVFKRRPIDGEDGKTFHIQPLKPVAELRKEALPASLPEEKGPFRVPELLDVTTLAPTIKLDLRYATDNNFLSTPLYPTSAKAYLQKPAAEALAAANKRLSRMGYGLLIHDAYRPWHVTKMFWDATPEKLRHFVADPAKGSRHNRGCAVDLTLYDLRTGKPVEMVSGFDEFSDRAYPNYMCGTSRQRWHRDTLRQAMEASGFTVIETEWWHFDYKDWREYGILNKTFEELARASK
jgi:CubicO group peptidase (beta-lactamase class C family)/D-alanyl-D-alanine dipeptidase